MNVKIIRLTGFMGMAAPVVGFTMIFFSIRLSPWFSWTGNALSDLGRSGFGSIPFNSGLPMTGAVMMVFSAGLFELTRGYWVGQAGSCLHLLASSILVALGIANINVEPWHRILSVSLFITLPLAMATMSVYAYRNRLKKYAYIGAATSLIAVLVWAIDWPGVAIPEAISALALTAWQVPLAYWMFTRKEETWGYGKTLLMSRRKGVVSLMCSSLSIHTMTRATPRP
jgi:hypothetical membrane protein